VAQGRVPSDAPGSYPGPLMSRRLTAPRALLVSCAVLVVVGSACSHADDPSLRADPAGGPRPTSSTLPVSTTAPPTTVAAPTSTVPFDLTTLRPPAPAGDPGGLAAQIVAAEATLRDGASGEEAVGRAALAQQVAYRQLGVHPEWDAAVLAAVPPALQLSVQRQAAARREFGAMRVPRSATPPAWRIIPPAPLAELQADYQAAAAATGVPWQYLAAVHLVETATGRIDATSTAGAQGPMQFLPATWAAYGAGGDIHNTRDAIFTAARYLAANGGATDIRPALWRYNHSDHYVLGVVLYGDIIAEHPLALRALYHWGVWYRTTTGDLYLPVGYAPPPG
jgi:membrane-bound lytic murein transglycosylase B